MRTVLLLIGLLVSPVSFAGDKQLTCLFISDDINGLLDKGAWMSDKIIFNTDDFGKLDPLLNVIREYKLLTKKDEIFALTSTYENLKYEVSPLSLMFEIPNDTSPVKYKVSRTSLKVITGETDGECSIGDVDVLRDRVF